MNIAICDELQEGRERRKELLGPYAEANRLIVR